MDRLSTPEEIARALRDLIERTLPCRHSVDFASVIWFGTSYAFTGSQARVVALLWRAWLDGVPNLRQETLLDAAGSVSGRLANLFKGHPAWGTMIVPGAAKGTFRLADPPPEANPQENPAQGRR